MAQTTPLAAGQTATTVDVPVTAPGVLSLIAAGPIPRNVTIGIALLTNGVPNPIGSLSPLADNGRMVIDANVTVRLIRPDISAYGVNVGVALDS